MKWVLLGLLSVWSGSALGQVRGLDPALRDTAVDPCTDFYQYACGGWLKAHPVPADRAEYGRDAEVEDANDGALRGILERAAAGVKAASQRSAGAPAQAAGEQARLGAAYAACMDTGAIEAAGAKGLRAELDGVDALAGKEAVPALLGALHTRGVDPLFTFGPEADARDAGRAIAAVGQPRLGLPEKGYYTRLDGASVELRDRYAAHIRRTLVLLGEPEKQAAADANTAVRIERKLAAASLTEEELRDPTGLYHKTALVQFEVNSPGLGFERYLKAAGAPAVQALNVAEPSYFLSLGDVLEGTSLAELKTYLRWAVARAAPATALPRDLDEEQFRFYGQALGGAAEQQPRWKRCVATVDAELGDALGGAYVAERFPASAKQRVETLTRAVEAAADKDLDSMAWLSPETRAEARRKLALVANHVGYPARPRAYAGLRMDPADAWGNAERAAAWERARQAGKIGRAVDRGDWELTAPTVNANYDPRRNSIDLPAGILQPPYFDPSEDDAVNYGSVGAVVGHELTHGFDDEGRQFDGLGDLRDWWGKADAAGFAERAQCVEREYDGFTAVDGLQVNGQLTLGEDLADLAGLRLAWLAFQGSPGAAGSEVDGLTPGQRFFTAYGQSWCANTRDAAMRQRVRVDPHAPERFRVNGVVRNVPGFAESWGCKQGAAMVAEPKCGIW